MLKDAISVQKNLKNASERSQNDTSNVVHFLKPEPIDFETSGKGQTLPPPHVRLTRSCRSQGMGLKGEQAHFTLRIGMAACYDDN